MDPEQKRLLEEIHSLAKDNHRLLRSVRRHQLLGTFWKLIAAVFVLVFLFYFYEAYMKPLVEKYSATASSTSSTGLFGLPSSSEFQKLLNSSNAGK